MSVDVLARTEAGAADPALVSTSQVWTYAALSGAVDRRADDLAASGVVRGSLRPVVVEADAEGIVTLLALWRLGAVPVPLNARSTEAERVAASALGWAPEGTQAVVWTSGTGGRPRGVALSFEAFAASADAAGERLGLGPADVWLASLSPAHVGGLALVTRSLLLGAAMVAAGGFDPGTASDLIDGRGLPAGAPGPVTHASFVPTQLLRLLEHRVGSGDRGDGSGDAGASAATGRPAPSTFRCALIGGAHAPAAVVERAHRAGWPLALTYGSTEMCSQVATAPPELVRRKPGTVGSALPGIELAIGEGDEILVRGATCALGYLTPGGTGVSAAADPAAVADSEGAAPPTGEESEPWRAVLAPVTDSSGWYHTGDLGTLDEEGHLRVTGRRVDRIVSGGVTIDAMEVEEALRTHPSVLDACVVGVPDEEWGERVAAWIDPVVGEFEPDEVGRHLRGLLSSAKLPRRWHVGGALPRNANGKVDRAEVRDRLAGA